MSKANRDRRRAKLKARERERKRRDHDRERSCATGHSADQARAEGPQQASEGWRTSQAEAAEFLVGAALHAQIVDDKEGFLWCVSQLAGEETAVPASATPRDYSAVIAGRPAATAGIPGWKLTVSQKLWVILVQTVTLDWHRGWQPAELVRQVERQFGSRHARLATDAVAAEMRGYAAVTVDDRWTAQLTALGAKPWWKHDDGYFTQWGARERVDRVTVVSCALQTLFALAAVPEMTRLCPLPGSARRAVTGDAA